jgi:hypothetical protein
MNKRLFEVRKIKPFNIGENKKKAYHLNNMPLIIVCVIIFSSFIFFFIKQNISSTSFLQYHNKAIYSPLNNENKGFYGKANYYLKKALSTKGNNESESLDVLYPRLKFYYPDTANYLISKDDIRLIGFQPQTPEEIEFYYNSDLKTLIEKQIRYPSQQYFFIHWRNKSNIIDSITVNTSALETPLYNNAWTGTISFIDPYSRIDPNVFYLIYKDDFLPIFNSNFPVNRLNLVTNSFDNFLEANKFLHSSIDNLYDSLNLVNNQFSLVYTLLPDANNRNFYIRALNSNGHIFFKTRGVNLVYGKTCASVDTTIEISTNKNIGLIQFSIRGRSEQTFPIYFSRTSPLTVASKSINQGITNERIRIDTALLDLFSRQQVNSLEGIISSSDKIDTVKLSTNILLSKYLENQLKSQVKELYNEFKLTKTDNFEMSMCLMDIGTGEIIAAPFYSNAFEREGVDVLNELRNFNLIRGDIGSTFKPIITLAAALKFESLSRFQLLHQFTQFGKPRSRILGFATVPYGYNRETGAEKGLFWSADYNNINRERFLALSHDNYPIALSMLALSEPNDSRVSNLLNTGNYSNQSINNLAEIIGENSRIGTNNQGRFLFMKGLSESSFINLISNLFSVSPTQPFDVKENALRYNISDWDLLNYNKQRIFPLIQQDQVSLNTEQIGTKTTDSTDFTRFERFILGQQDNKWTNIKLAEAYARILSKHFIKGTFIKTSNPHFASLFTNPDSLFDYGSSNYPITKHSADMERIWTNFIDNWRDAVRDRQNTTLLWPANNRFLACPLRGDKQFFCKTGTPQENPIPNKYVNKGKDTLLWIDEGLFVFGICNNDAEFPKGVVGVVRIKHSSLNKITGGIESVNARDFLTTAIYNKILFYCRDSFR